MRGVGAGGDVHPVPAARRGAELRPLLLPRQPPLALPLGLTAEQ